MSPQMGRYTLQDDIARMAAHVADLDAHTRNIWETLRVGEYLAIGVSPSGASGNPGADKLLAHAFIVPRTMTFDRLAIDVAAGVGGAFARIGIYADGANHYPGALILDAGAVSTAAVGVVAATINQQLTKGLYWLALISDSTATFARITTSQLAPLGLDAADFTRAYIGWSVAQAYGALPDPFTVGAALQDTAVDMPLVAPRLASLD